MVRLAPFLVTGATGHFMMVEPSSRAMLMVDPQKRGLAMAGDCAGVACAWYTQQAFSQGPVTNCDPRMRTLGVNCGSSNPDDFPCIGPNRRPWCAPGTAPVTSPCGVYNGGYEQGGRDMRDLPGEVQATWVLGSTAPVSWSVTANHGGGYSYRLCPVDAELSEECFQKHVLEFSSNRSWVVDRQGNELVEFEAVRSREGTWPAGSEWTKSPIPMEVDEETYGKPPMPGLHGPGPQPWSIRDRVHVPEDLAPGKYVLSYRWDSESVSQVWQDCSDVELVASEEARQVSMKAGPERPLCQGASWGLDVNECTAWVELFDAMDGPNWKGCSEHRLDPCGCPQTHWGATIFCNSFQNYQHIHEIYLLNNSLRGQVPKSIGQLSRLLALDMSENLLTGTVPSELGDIETLEALWLHHNPRLGGSIPESFLKRSFYAFELQYSNFSGQVPALNYWNISNCLLYGNAFECPIPEEAKACGGACRDTSVVLV